MSLEDILKILGGGSIFAIVSMVLEWRNSQRKEDRENNQAKHAIQIDWYDRARVEVLKLEEANRELKEYVEELEKKNADLIEQDKQKERKIKALQSVIQSLEESIERIKRDMETMKKEE